MPTITISERTGADFAGITSCNLRLNAPTTNYPGGSSFEVTEYFTGDYKHNVFRLVDNTGLSGVTVSGATLGVFVDSGGLTGTAGQAFALHKVTATTVLTEATWNNRTTGSAWTVAGCFTAGQSDATDVNVTARATFTGVTANTLHNFSGAGMDSDLSDLLNGTISELIYVMVRTDGSNDFAAVEFRGIADTTSGPIFTVPYTTASVPAVSTVSSNSAAEGTGIVHTVTLASAVTGSPAVYALALAGVTATGGGVDFTSALTNSEFSDGVTISGGDITVPVAVSSFTVTVPTINDVMAEPAETYTLTVGGTSGTGTINASDAEYGVMATQITRHGNGRHASYGLQRGYT